MAKQLPLPLVRDPDYSRESLIISASNEAALAWIEQWPAWPSHAVLLVGAPSSGKTHLAHIWARHANAAFFPDIDVQHMQHGVVDDADSIDNQTLFTC